MPSKQQLETALINADKAGDTQAATLLATALKNGQFVENVPSSQGTPAPGASTEEPQWKATLRALYQAPKTIKDILSYSLDFGGAGRRAGDLAVEAGTKLGLPPEATGALAATVDVGISQGIPLALGAGIGAKAAPAIQGGAQKIMQSALKPTIQAARTGKAARAIQTVLDQGINVTPGGVRKLRGLIDDLNTEIKAKIANSNAVVDKDVVASYLDDIANKFKQQVNPQSDLASVQKAYDDFMNHPLLVNKSSMSVQEAQALKQGTYKQLGDKAYGEMKSADIEAQKGLARGLKEQIAAKVPDIAGLNAQESDMLNALSVIERRTLIAANKNPVGLSWLARNPKAAAAFMADRSELFKSLLARMINHNARAIGATAGGVGSEIMMLSNNKKSINQERNP